MKKLLCILLFSAHASILYADDFKVIFDRLYKTALTLPSSADVQTVLSQMNTNGSFSDLDYKTSGDLVVHLTRINKLACAYKHTGSAYYMNTNIQEKYFLGLDFWVSTNHKPSNWWYRHIAYPKTTWPGIILMSDVLKSKNTGLYNRALDYLLWAYLQNNYMEGANGADKISGAYPASILRKDTTQMLKFRSQIIALVQIQSKGEGIETDMMFGQHSGSGRQVYANYEVEYLKSILSYMTMVNATVFNVTSKEIGLLEKLYMEGIQWIIYANHIDPSQTGRKNSSTAGVSAFATQLASLIALDPPKKSQLQIVHERMQKGLSTVNPPLSGNKMYWRFDYMLQRGNNYFASSRMTSKRTVGAEAGNGEGNNNYYGGAGVNYIFRTGNEYSDGFFAAFNYRQFPGITAEQDAAALPIPNWGANGNNNNIFAGGVSSGEQGACGMILDKRGITANKAWFYFNNEFIALGAAIRQTAGTAAVYTTINQCIRYSTVDYFDNNAQGALSSTGSVALAKPEWVIQDQVGYFNLDNTSSFIVSNTAKNGSTIFTCNIDHGKNPAGKTYAYVVKPGITTSEAGKYLSNMPLQVLENSSNIQAVKHKVSGLIQMIFYNSGKLDIPGSYTIEAISPCAIMLKTYGDSLEISLANPKCESANPASMAITINKKLLGNNISWDGTKTTITFSLPQGLYAGQTVTKKYRIDHTTEIDKHANDREIIHIYPNPVRDKLYINTALPVSENIKISIHNVTGTCVYQAHEHDIYKQYLIGMGHLPNGIYHLRIESASALKTYKLVLVH